MVKCMLKCGHGHTVRCSGTVFGISASLSRLSEVLFQGIYRVKRLLAVESLRLCAHGLWAIKGKWQDRACSSPVLSPLQGRNTPRIRTGSFVPESQLCKFGPLGSRDEKRKSTSRRIVCWLKCEKDPLSFRTSVFGGKPLHPSCKRRSAMPHMSERSIFKIQCVEVQA